MKNKKVLLAMSGGVDSSVAALLLKKQGYEIIAAFMKNWSDTKNSLGECAWRDERKMAMKVASILNIPLITLDFEKQYKKQVVDKMFEDYKKGITPNPDIDCNQKVKFPLLIKEAKKLGADYIATGHYSRIKKKGKFFLLRAKNEAKDQSYFLYRINQNELKYTLFPIGNLSKKKVRQIAKKHNFPNYNKKSTVGICFIGKINLKEFLSKKIKPKKGNIINPHGEIIGQHDGIYYYTIGQRLGPRYGFELDRNSSKNGKNLKRWYVARKDLKKNIIIAAPEDHPLNYRKNIIIRDEHWITDIPSKTKKTNVLSRIRQVGELLPSTLHFNPKTKNYQISLKKPITGVSQGQAIVLYRGKKVLGGGVIDFE